MNPLIQLRMIVLSFVGAFALGCFAFLPRAQALNPPPDGGYPFATTAEGDGALGSLTLSGKGRPAAVNNTALGFDTLFNNTGGNSNTATGARALFDNITGSGNTATGYRALFHNTVDGNTADGFQALFSNTVGTGNTALGYQALYSNIGSQMGTFSGGVGNIAVGPFALYNNTGTDVFTGNLNVAIGGGALYGNTTGTGNVAVGIQALYPNNGNGNIAVGSGAGGNLTAGDNNIDIGNLGVVGESNTIRIGGDSGYGPQTATYIAGISGRTASDGAAVYVNSDGKLGTSNSSIRFKDAIKPMDKASAAILALKPVTFHYKKELDPKSIPQFGLVAEEVEKVNPDLVVRDKEGKPYSVRYDQVNAMLLNEFLKEHRKVEELKSAMARQEATIAKQQEGIKALRTQLKEQAAQIQNVSAQLETRKPGPQVVENN